MKKLLIATMFTTLLVGCIRTENRLVQVRRPSLYGELVSIHSGTTSVWWNERYHDSDIDNPNNPWNKFVRTTEDKWYDPWSQDPATNYGANPSKKVVIAPFSNPVLPPEPRLQLKPLNNKVY